MNDNLLYTSIEQANEVLDFYEHFLLRSPYIMYIAVVEVNKKNRRGYGLEIGINKEGDGIVQIDYNITAIDAYLGKFDKNKVPALLPVPSEFYHRIRNYVQKEIDYPINNQEAYSLIQTNTSIIEKISIPVKNQFVTSDNIKLSQYSSFVKSAQSTQEEFENISEYGSWFKYPYGSQPIISEGQNEGTLGGIFKLLQYPDSLFGITNWHIFSGSKMNLGEDVFCPNGKSIGTLFWTAVDTYKEVAFIKFNKKTSCEILSRYKLKKWAITQPKIGMSVYQNGYGSYSGSNHCSQNYTCIHSINTTIRIQYSSGQKIFKRQLLIEDISTDGDSGALLISKENQEEKVVGLIFSLTSLRKRLHNGKLVRYSVANDINFIFNKPFCQKQEVFNEIQNNIITTTLIDHFTLDNFKLLNN
ncbi:hypothetical protein [Aquimarina sp. Aq78]|uniref:hypothetical protein n=1 Tax=Aquimarina sp. Aq78 TaxID=1191889 RepID=UPI000D0FCD6D|nr:hypothetical protein [Aquimarina sp. Aq78]